MSEQDFLQELGNRGLRRWQANFVASFLKGEPSALQLLAAPTGMGKMHAAIAIVQELTNRGAERILVLAPAPLCEAWRTRVGKAQSHIPVSVVTRQEYREMEAAIPLGQSPWAVNGVFVLSQDFAKQPDIGAELAMVAWDLVVVDEAHRFAARQRSALLNQLLSAGFSRRLLLLAATPLSALDWLRPSLAQAVPLAITSWYGELRNWDGSVVARPRVDWEVARYARGADEVRFLAQLLEVAAALEPGSGYKHGNRLLSRLLKQRAASSTFAVEQSLQRLHHTLRFRVANITAQIEADSDTDRETEDLNTEGKTNAFAVADASSGFKLVERCLEALEFVNTDEKLSALKTLVQYIALAKPGQTPRMCILSMYVDTVAYLYSALQETEVKIFKITGRDAFVDRAKIVEDFRRADGLLISTDAGISGGIELRDVTHIIHYDVPTSPKDMEQRLGKVDRYGRMTPYTMYVFRDDSGAIPGESEVIDHLVA